MNGHRNPRRRKSSARTLGTTPYRAPFAAGVPLTENPNRGKRHGAQSTAREHGFTQSERDAASAARRQYLPLHVSTVIAHDRAGRRRAPIVTQGYTI